MTKALLEVVLHPVRMQIVQALAPDKRLTAAQIGERLPSIPQASLYRHLNKLVEAGLLTVVEQNQVRGTLEKVYALQEVAPLNPDELTKEDHLRFFLTFTANVAQSFEEYLRREGSDPSRDWVSYRAASFYATPAEFEQFITALRATFELVLNNSPAPGRIGLNMATILIPTAGRSDEKQADQRCEE